MLLFTSTMPPFDKLSREKLNKWEAKAEMWENKPLLNGQRHLDPVEPASANQGIMGENEVKETPRKGRIRNERARDSLQKISRTNLDDLEVGSPPKKRTRM